MAETPTGGSSDRTPASPTRPLAGDATALKPPGHVLTARDLLDDKLDTTRRVILWERIWPALVAPSAVVLLFVAVSLFGLWLVLPVTGRIVGVIAFGALLAWSLLSALRIVRPSSADAERRLDLNGGFAHRPVATMMDNLPAGASEESRALWALHQKRAAERIAAIPTPSPDPAMRRRDPMALRFAPLALAVAGLFAAGPNINGSLMAAFEWSTPPVPPPAPRVDAWIDPPAYTGRAPIFLSRADRQGEAGQLLPQALSVPTGSVVVVRATPPAGMDTVVSGGLTLREGAAAAAFERRYLLSGNGRVLITRDGRELTRYDLTAIPDQAPAITLVETRPTENRDGLTLVYRAQDDYGIAEARADVTLPVKPGETARRTLLPAPSLVLSIPSSGRTDADAETTITVGDSPWAGARVDLKLWARDDAGNTAESNTVQVTLPQRTFTNPLAKALVEQRRNLVLDPDRRDRVQIALDALLTPPDSFQRMAGVYLGLKIGADRLRAARGDADLLGVAEWLWTMALDLEDGGLSDAERQLREAQERLRDALERNADANEIRRLTEELRRAMDRYMRELAERALRDQRNADNQQQNDPNSRQVRPDDFRRMLEEIERLAREGKQAEAQQLLEQLNRMMENLQITRGRQPMDQRERSMNEAMNELDQLTREQQELRDRTYRDGQQRRQQQGQQGRQQKGQQGQQGGRQQPGQRGQRGQQGQQGQQGEGGEQDMAEGGEGQEGQGGQGLQQRQQQLRDRLRQLQQRMRELGMNPEQGLSDAEGAMGDAEGQLGRGQEGRAVDSQGRALEGLRRGMQGMAQQMQQEGEGEGETAEGPGGNDQGRPGQPRRADGGQRNDDPLGRPTRSRDHSDGRVRIPGADESVAERARQVLEELRRRLGETERPRGELEYFERLLPRN
jgi:uncharacterized protein (TIGR02302 family)